MALNTNFDRAEYAAPLDVTPEVPNAPSTPDATLFIRALLCGVVGAVAGALIDAVFIGITHINLGYVALFVAYIVARAMAFGSRGQGGRFYQISALVLTYLSVAAAQSALLYWDLHRTKHLNIPLGAHNLLLLAKYGLQEPFLRFQQSFASALIGLFILFIGLRAAWRMTSGIPGAVSHPFSR